MSQVDRRRISAVRTLEALGYSFHADRWHPPLLAPAQRRWTEADALHRLLVQRADTLIGCTMDQRTRTSWKSLARRSKPTRLYDGPMGRSLGARVEEHEAGVMCCSARR
jgi:hypothetical protein